MRHPAVKSLNFSIDSSTEYTGLVMILTPQRCSTHDARTMRGEGIGPLPLHDSPRIFPSTFFKSHFSAKGPFT